VAPVVRVAVLGAVLSRALATLALLAQAHYVANALGGLFVHAGANVTGDLTGALIATGVRALAVSGGDGAVSALARPLRRHLRASLLDRRLSGSLTRGLEGFTLLATDGVNAVENYVSTILPSLALAVLAPGLIILALLVEDPLSALIVVVCVVVLPPFMVLLGLAARDSMEERLSTQTRLAGYFGDMVRGLSSLRSLGRSGAALDTLEEAETAYRRSTLETLRVAFLSGFALELLASLATALVALVLGLRLVGAHVSLPVALFVLIVTPEVFIPLRNAAAQFHASALGVAAAGELLDIVEQPVETRGTRVLPPGPLGLSLRGVVVGPPEREGARSDRVDVSLPAGEMLVVTGASGVGKSTLLRCLAGLERPLEGEILVAGRDPFEYEPRGFRSRVVLLSQDPVLPGDTVRDIIDLGRGVGEEEIRAALRASALDLDLDRRVGEGASALSAGQRRRLAIARALVGGPDLLLLDEPLAHLDEENVRFISRTLNELSVTRVVVTHRPLVAEFTLHVSRGVSA
jgi:ATP-binding cassette subfamily C protein CydCD